MARDKRLTKTEELQADVKYLFEKINWADSFLDARAVSIMSDLESKIQTLANWQDIETHPHNILILAHFVNPLGKSRIVKVKHIEAKTVESSVDSEISEYDEVLDRYFEPEGWYEDLHEETCCGFTSLYMGEDIAATHWMPLPEPPNPDSNEPQLEEGSIGLSKVEVGILNSIFSMHETAYEDLQVMAYSCELSPTEASDLMEKFKGHIN